jgi:general secretion pathway protein D
MRRVLFFILGASVLFGTDEIGPLKERLEARYREAAVLVEKGSDEAEFKKILDEVTAIRGELKEKEEEWRRLRLSENDEASALWDLGEASLSQLIMEYGSADALYVIPQELGALKIHLFSGLPVPRESWGEMIEMILSQNGIGVKKLNPYARQLYVYKLDPSAIEAIVGREEDLPLFPPSARLFFVLAPKTEQLKSARDFFERFADPKVTTVQAIGSKLTLVSTREQIEHLLGLYHAVWEKDQGKVVRHMHLTKMAPSEAEKILKATFADTAIRMARPPGTAGGTDELATLVLPQGLVLVGEAAAVERGERLLADLELQLEDPGEKVVYWYSCKHSSPEDVAKVLDQVYDSLRSAVGEKKEEKPVVPAPPPTPPAQECISPLPIPTMPGFTPPSFAAPVGIEGESQTAFGHFIVDPKTASVLMVVRREELPKIKSLLKRLDVPKRMVQIDVLLVEKRLTDRKESGVNLLKLGTASGTRETAISYDSSDSAVNKGILSFILNRPKGKFPAFDLTYNFLLAQDNLQINANPSILAVNQTPAQISIVEEISINNGAVPFDIQGGGFAVEKSYTRANYGITIAITPTIHLPNEEDPDSPGFVTLQTNVTFDTTLFSTDDRPPVTRRHIENEVQIADGETVILGGLRRKSEEDQREKIPFLGDIPGIGKLFGTFKSKDTNTEMFIFITPHIIHDPVADLRRLRDEEYALRAGDVPEFLKRLDEAKEKDRKKYFEDSLKLLFDTWNS